MRTVIQLRDKIIRDGIVSVKRNETRPERIRGGIKGFEICKELASPADFERVLQERYQEERRLVLSHTFSTPKTEEDETEMKLYQEYRYATVQIEFVWERLKIAWSVGGGYSTKAIMHVNNLLKGAL